MAHGPQVLQLLEVFFVSNLFLDDLALRMALEAQLERGDRGPATVELLGSSWAASMAILFWGLGKVDLYHQGEEVLILLFPILHSEFL